MKMSYKQLSNFCASINATLLKNTRYGVKVEKRGSEVLLVRGTRKLGDRHLGDKEVFRGTTKECYIYLVALRDTLIDWYPLDNEKFRELDGTQSRVKFM